MNHRITISFLILFPFFLQAQKETYNWTFGGNAGMSFHFGEPRQFVPASGSFEGCATISDADGQLLFYTEGESMKDRKGNRLEFLRGDDRATQSSLFVPWPERDSLYYIFIAPFQASNPFRYAVFNKNLNQGLGGTHAPVRNLFPNSTEKQAAVRHTNGRDYWLVTHTFPGNTFQSYLIKPAGLDTIPVISVAGSSHGQINDPNAIVGETEGQMKISPDGTRLALVVKYAGILEIFDFDATTGTISNPVQVSGFSDYVDGVEFSQNSKFVYVSERGIFGTLGNNDLPSRIWGFELDAQGGITQQKLLFESFSILTGQLQLAPNGYIYFPKYREVSLGAIKRPNTSLTEAEASIDTTSFRMNQLHPDGHLASIAWSGLPNFVSSFLAEPYVDFGTERYCLGDTTVFGAFSNVSITSWTWNFGDPASAGQNISSQQFPYHIFTNTGTYEVQLIGYIDQVPVDTVSKTIEIIPDFAYSLEDKSLCPGSSVRMTYPDPGLKYLWSTQDTVRSVVLDQGGEYQVRMEDSRGCRYTDTFYINYLPEVRPDLGEDTLFCLPGLVQLDAYGPHIDTYQWNTGDTTSLIEVDKAGSYSVRVVGNGCVAADTIRIFTDVPPEIDLGEDRTICRGQTVRLSGGQADSYLWSTGEKTAEIEAFSGLYYLIGSSSNGCTAIDTVEIIDQPLPEAEIVQKGDSLIATPGYASYSWKIGDDIIENANQPFLLPDQPGVYKVVVTDANACFITAAIFLEDPTGTGGPCNDLRIYPTPGTALFHIDLNGMAIEQMKLINLQGRLVWSSEGISGQTVYDIDLEDRLSAGAYFLYLKSGSCEAIYKLLVYK